MSECAVRYALAIEQPFSPKAYGACVPSSNSRKSAKFHNMVRTVVSSGNTGNFAGQIGIWFVPCLAYDMPVAWTFSDPSGGYDLSVISFANLWADAWSLLGCLGAPTTPYTYADLYAAYKQGVTGKFDIVAAKLRPIYISNYTNPVSAADLVPGSSAGSQPAKHARMVSYGIRVGNISQSAIIGGQIAAFVHPTHDSVYANSYTDYSANPECRITALNKTAYSMSVYALTEAEREYSLENSITRISSIQSDESLTCEACYPFCAGALPAVESGTPGTYMFGNTFGAPVGFMILQPLVSANWAAPKFQVGVIQHIEVTGKGVDSLLTDSHNDPTGLAIVVSAINAAQTQQKGTNTNSWNQLKILDKITSVGTKVIENVSRVVESPEFIRGASRVARAAYSQYARSRNTNLRLGAGYDL